MRDIPATLQAKLNSGETTLCRCWRIDRADGASLGFTDHDAWLRFDGTEFSPETALSPSALETAEGLAVDTVEVAGAFNSSAITAQDVALGLYDGALVRQWLVDWREPEDRLLLFSGALSEVRRSGAAFSAELRSLADKLNRPQGRQYLPNCSAALGDAACGVDLNGFRASGAVLWAQDDRLFAVSGFDAFDSGWFSRGRLSWTSGANTPTQARIKRHAQEGGEIVFELWAASAAEISVGDGFSATAGCDKSFKTCAQKFSNRLNFRGFPHIPGEDWITRYPTSGDRNDGTSRNGGA